MPETYTADLERRKRYATTAPQPESLPMAGDQARQTMMQRTAAPEPGNAALATAQKKAIDRLNEGNVYADDKWQEVADYYAEPLLDASKSRQEGIRFDYRRLGIGGGESGRLGEALLKEYGDTEKQVNSSVYIPLLLEQIRQKDESARADISQAASIGGQVEQLGLSQRAQRLSEIEQRESSAARAAGLTGQLGDQQTLAAKQQAADIAAQRAGLTGYLEGEETLASRQLRLGQEETAADRAERARQFDAQLEVTRDQFAQSIGLNRAELDERIDARLAGNELADKQLEAQIDQFIKDYGLRERQQQEEARQFDAQLEVTKNQFAQSIGLNRAELDERIDARLAGNELADKQLEAQIDQFIKDYGLRERQQQEEARQFDAQLEVTKNQFAQSIGLNRAELDERINARLAGNELADKQLEAQIDQFIQDYGLRERQQNLAEKEQDEASQLRRDQYNQTSIQFMAQLGLQRDEFNEAVRRALSQEGLADKQLQASIEQYYAGLSQEERQWLAEQTGQIFGGQSQVGAAELGISMPEGVDWYNDANRAQRDDLVRQMQQAHWAATGKGLTAAQINTLLAGGKIDVEGQQTMASRQLGLQAQEQSFRQQLENQQFGLEQQRQQTADTLSKIQGAVALAQQSGQLTTIDPITEQTVSVETLASKAQQFQQDLEALEQSLRQTQFLVQQTGQVSGTGQLTAATLGIDPSAFSDADPQAQARLYEQATQAFSAATGRAPTTQELTTLLRGGAVQTSTQQTLAARQLGSETSFQSQRLQLEQEVQDLNAALQNAATFGQGVDPTTGKTVQTLAAEIQRAQVALQQSDITGKYLATNPITGAKVELRTLAAQQQQFEQALAIADQVGTLEVIHPITGSLVSKDTLAQEAQDLRAEIERGQLKVQQDQQKLAEDKQRFDEILGRAEATGDYVDPELNLSVETLQKWQTQLEQARVTGVMPYTGEETLAKQQQDWEQSYRDKSTFGYDAEDGTHVYGTNELQLVLQNDQQQFQQMMEAGYTYVDPETGQERRVLGTDERIESERQYTEMVRTGYSQILRDENGNPMYQTVSAASLGVDVASANQLNEPEISAKLRTAFERAVGYAPNGTQLAALMRGDRVQGQPIVKHVEGTQEYASRIAEREASLTEKGMDLDDAHRQAVLEWDREQQAGFYQTRTVSLKSLGVAEAFANESFIKSNGEVDYQRFFEWADNPANSDTYARLRSALGGREPTAEQLTQLLRGQAVATVGEDGQPITDWVEGAVSLERSRIDLQERMQQAGFTQEKAILVAQQAYDDKVRNGYYAHGENGQMTWVRGTQSQDEYLLKIQQDFQVDQAEAERMWQERQRVGYDQVVDVMTPSGPRTTTIRIEGTQELQERLAQAEREGREDLTSLQWELAQKERTGYFQDDGVDQYGQPKYKWVSGTEDHEEKIQALADQLTRDGWDAEEALQEARITSQESEAGKQRAHDKFLSERQWYYEQQSIDKADARQKAEQDWQTAERALDRTFDLESIRERADLEEARLQRQLEWDRTNAVITATVGATGKIWDLLNNDSGDVLARLLEGEATVDDLVAAGIERAVAERTIESLGADGFAAVLTPDGRTIPAVTTLTATPGVAASATSPSGLALAGPFAVAAVLAVGAGIYHQKKEATRRDAFDAAYDQMPSELQRQIEDIWTADYNDPYQPTSWGDRETQWGDRDSLMTLLEDIQENGGKALDLDNGRTSASAAGRAKIEKAERAYRIYQLIESGSWEAEEQNGGAAGAGITGSQQAADTANAGGNGTQSSYDAQYGSGDGSAKTVAADPAGDLGVPGFSAGPRVSVAGLGNVVVSSGSAQSLPADKIRGYLDNGTLKIEGNLIKAGSGTVLGVIEGGAGTTAQQPSPEAIYGSTQGQNGADARTQYLADKYGASTDQQAMAEAQNGADKTAAQREIMNFGSTIDSLESLRYAQGADAVIYTIVTDARRRGTPMTYDYARQLATRAGIIA